MDAVDDHHIIKVKYNPHEQILDTESELIKAVRSYIEKCIQKQTLNMIYLHFTEMLQLKKLKV